MSKARLIQWACDRRELQGISAINSERTWIIYMEGGHIRRTAKWDGKYLDVAAREKHAPVLMGFCRMHEKLEPFSLGSDGKDSDEEKLLTVKETMKIFRRNLSR